MRTLAALVLFTVPSLAVAEVGLPSVFTSHMVLQRDHANPVWGWAEPGEAVRVAIGGQVHETEADAKGNWRVVLKPLKAGTGPHTLTVKGSNELTCEDVLVGEVWVCSGQSNMAFNVARSYDGDLAIAAAKFPQIRLLSVPNVGTQEPQRDFKGEWKVCSPETVGDFSAVGYYFGRQLHQTLDVPVGLIDNAWGGSAAEAWVNREKLEADEFFEPLLVHWDEMAKTFDFEERMQQFEAGPLAQWRERARAARQAGKPIPQRPRAPRNVLTGQHRPANLYNGVLKPTIGYGIRGAIWYQGEANSSRAVQYRTLFPLMIQNWRDEWGQGAFPFYWVQLADFRAEQDGPADSDWAELREAQTMTMQKLENTGQAVITDVGEGRDIHPRDKLTVGKRLARIALARDYGMDVAYRSPEFAEATYDGPKVTVKCETFGSKLVAFDTNEVRGFEVAGEDGTYHPAKARLVDGRTIEVQSADVKQPVAVRYAWADNPIANVRSAENLPLTSFRTDDWKRITDGVHVR